MLMYRREALDILLLAMERHNLEKHVQISGSASLYYVVKSDDLKREMNVKVGNLVQTCPILSKHVQS